MWTTWRQTRPRHVSFCCLSRQLPKFTRPSSRRSLTPYETLIPIKSTSTSAQKKRGAPDCCFVGAFPSFRCWQAGEWQLVEFSSTSLRQDTSEPNPRLRYRPFDFHVTASLLGKIATAFCRDGLERPGDVICIGASVLCWAHPFARSLSFTCQGLRCASCKFSVWSFLLQVACLDRQQ